MNNTPATRAAAAAEVTLLLSIGALGFIIYVANASATPSPVLLTLASLAMASMLVLHVVFVALLARRSSRPATWYAVGALLTFPIGSAVGLVLYEWHCRVDSPAKTGAA